MQGDGSGILEVLVRHRGLSAAALRGRGGKGRGGVVVVWGGVVVGWGGLWCSDEGEERDEGRESVCMCVWM